MFVLVLAVLGIGGLVVLPWLGSANQRERRRRVASAVIGPYDEIWHPSGREAVIVWEAQQQAATPNPLPGDPPAPPPAPPPARRYSLSDGDRG